MSRKKCDRHFTIGQAIALAHKYKNCDGRCKKNLQQPYFTNVHSKVSIGATCSAWASSALLANCNCSK
ncbi:MAG: hypothetical protein N2235_22290 [Fischerella sp.]|nr:hypothetical protein [Fischerella sp.]